jgi:hypothetical protein
MTRPLPTPLDRALRRTVIGHFVTVIGALTVFVSAAAAGGPDFYGAVWYWVMVGWGCASLLASASWTCWMLPRLGALRAGLRRPPG